MVVYVMKMLQVEKRGGRYHSQQQRWRSSMQV
jgi:hypothetical protein